MAVDPATDEGQRAAEDAVDRAALAAQIGILAVIAERLGAVSDGDTQADAAEWAIEDEQRMADAMTRGRAVVTSAVASVFADMGRGNDEWAAAYYEAAGRAAADASGILSEGLEKAKERVSKTLSTSVVGLIDDRGAFVPLYEGYRAVVSRAVAGMAVGEQTYQQAVADAVTGLSRNGLRVRYESGATRELYAAVRTNVMDAYRTTMSAQRIAHGKAFGADGVEVSAHDPCAPDHLPFQGRRYSDAQWRETQSGLTRPLVTGWNCKHSVSPVIMGIGKAAYSPEELEAMRKRSDEAVTFNGVSGRELTMTRYKATQYQRQIETGIRKRKVDALLLDEANLPAFSKMASNDASALTRYYKSMSAEVGLGTRMERTKAYVIR